MARKKKHAAHENHERWLVSYADFITLLFAFFVVMFASSQTDKAKAKQVSESFTEAIQNGKIPEVVANIIGGARGEKERGNMQMKGPGGSNKMKPETEKPPEPSARLIYELMPSLDVLKKQLQKEIADGMVQISMEPRGLTISLKQAAFFPSGQEVIDPQTFPTLAKVAEAIQKLPNKVRLEGHTDSDPIHTERFRSNWDLSVARAVTMLELLESKYKVDPARMSAAGYADTVPVADNTTSEGKKLNRRVDVLILNDLGMKGEPKPAEQPAAAHGAKPEQAKPDPHAKTAEETEKPKKGAHH